MRTVNPLALEPPGEWATLRQECPVARVRLASGDEAMLLTRYDDVRQMLSDPRFTHRLNAADAARASDTDAGGAFANDEALDRTSGDGHLRWRRLVGKWFTAKRMNALRPRIAAIADHLIDEMTQRPQPADLVSGLGFPVPVWAICHILGVPDADRDDFARWSDALLSLTRYTQEEMAEALRFDANFGFGVPRYLSEEFDVGETTLPVGTTVVCSISSANRDENAFDGADTMDVGRSPNPHITFGVGPHSCIGQALARTELNVVLEVLLRWLPSLELAVPAHDLPRRDGFIVGGLERLPVRW